MGTELPRHLILVQEIVQKMPIVEHTRVHQLRTGPNKKEGRKTHKGPTIDLRTLNYRQIEEKVSKFFFNQFNCFSLYKTFA